MFHYRILIVAFLMFFANQANAQRLTTVFNQGTEIERQAMVALKPIQLTQEIISKINLPQSLSTTLNEGALRFAIENKVANERNKMVRLLKSGEINTTSITEYATSVKERIINQLNKLSKEDWERINQKFGAKEHHEHSVHSENRAPGGPCLNPDFESCNFSDWEMFTGSVPYPSPAPFSFGTPTPTTTFATVSAAGSGTEQHYIVNGGTDPIGGFPMVYPGGTCSAEIGDFTNYGNGASQIRKTFMVSSGDAILTLNYAVCLEDAGHTAAEQPYFRMRVYDAFGASITCAEYEAVAGDGQPGWVNSGTWQYKPWTTVFIPLAPYIGQNVTVEFTVGDCAQGGHAGYAYVDASCDAMSFEMTASAVCAGSPITISAPPGASSYAWSTGATTQTITVSTAGTYSVTVTPVTGSACAITLDTTVVAYPNPIAAFNDDAPVCVGTPVNFTDNSNPSGATISAWSWNFGDGGTSTLQNPTHTYTTPGTYTVTLTVTTTNGCTNTITQNVTINPGGTATITPAGPFCTSDPVTTLSATPGGGTWSASCGTCINSTTGAFDPSLASLGTNTINYITSGACASTGSSTITINEVVLNGVTVTDVSCFGLADGTITINATGATQYSIDGGTSFSASSSFTGLAAGTYSIVIENAIGCQATSTATIVEPPLLTAVPGFQDETCFGACDGFVVIAPAGGTSPYSFAWSGPSGTSTNALFNNVCVGTYTVTVTDDHGCIVNASSTVGGPAQLVISSITTTPETCPFDCSGTLTVTATGGTGALQYSTNGGLSFQATGNFSSVCSGSYNVVVVDASGCQATGTTSLTPLNPILLSTSANDTVCIGQSTTISASSTGGTGTVTYAWDNGVNTASQTVDPAGTTVYTVTATDVNGCNVSESVVIVENPPLNVIALSNQTICPGASANISAIGSGGNGGPYTYTWINNQTAGSLFGANQTVSPNTTTQYTVILTDGCGTPADSASITIGLFSLPTVTFDVDTTQGCAPLVVNFTNTTNPLFTASCLWDFGDGTSSTDCTPQHVFPDDGCYDISLTVTTVDGCIVDTTLFDYICVFPFPIAEFSFSPMPADIYNPNIEFTNLTIGGNTYEWNFVDFGYTTDEVNPSFSFPANDGGIYPVCLWTENTHGCVDTVCHDVIINGDFIVYVPNAFTPDGDGRNEGFLPVVQGIDPAFFDFMIFNRWGELIFRTGQVGQAWDGTHKNMKAKEDVYVWKLKVKSNVDGKKKEFVGHVTLLR